MANCEDIKLETFARIDDHDKSNGRAGVGPNERAPQIRQTGMCSHDPPASSSSTTPTKGAPSDPDASLASAVSPVKGVEELGGATKIHHANENRVETDEPGFGRAHNIRKRTYSYDPRDRNSIVHVVDKHVHPDPRPPAQPSSSGTPGPIAAQRAPSNPARVFPALAPPIASQPKLEAEGTVAAADFLDGDAAARTNTSPNTKPHISLFQVCCHD